MSINRLFLVVALFFGFCSGCGKSNDSSENPSGNIDNPKDSVELTEKTFGCWSESLWEDFKKYRSRDVKILNDWRETSEISEDSLVDFVEASTDIRSVRELDFVAVFYRYRSNGIFELSLGRAKKDIYPELDFITLYDDDADGRFDKAIIGETLDEKTIKKVANVKRGVENSKEFEKIDALLAPIKQDSKFELKRKRWDGMWKD